jgi:hypothetical protein
MGRTPRNYEGTQITDKKLSELLPEVLKKIRTSSEVQSEEIFSFWFELVGGKIATLTEPVSFVEQILTIRVKSASLYSLLAQHEKARLLKELQKRFTIRGLNFRIG